MTDTEIEKTIVQVYFKADTGANAPRRPFEVIEVPYSYAEFIARMARENDDFIHGEVLSTNRSRAGFDCFDIVRRREYSFRPSSVDRFLLPTYTYHDAVAA